jgi:hypothetical protein
MPNLAALHDRESVAIAPPDTWAIDTVSLSENPQPIAYPTSLKWITRLNHGYGSTGTLPHPDMYNWFAQKVAAYVAGSSGCRRWVIGNECNLRREWPDHAPIYPWHYAACFKICRDAIHALPGHASDEVLVAASGPWNDECKYEGNPKGDWITYFTDVLSLLHGEFDGYALHSYTHGYDVNLVTSTARMDAPFQNRYYNFLCYRDYCDAIPLEYSHLPAYITEANGDGPWQAVGLMPAMLGEIDFWNRSNNAPLIHCVAFFRYPRHDHFYIEGRDDVIAEYRAAVEQGYHSPIPSPIPEPPLPPDGEWIPELPISDREIDPVLAARGVEFDFISPPAGTGYWRITFAEHLNEEEADAAGPDHHILGRVIDDGKQVAGVELRVEWPSGHTTVISKVAQHILGWNYDFPMSSSLNEFSIWVDDGNPSDKAMGIGMGAHGNPSIHTSTFIDFEYTIAERPIPPIEPPIKPPVELAPLLWPVDGPITDDFGTPPARFGCIGHNGMDIACRLDTPVLSIADGLVVYTGEDVSYGRYCRVWHKALHFQSFYAHLESIGVRVGQAVQRGQTIALSGSTGNSTGPHVHFELRGSDSDGNYLDVTYGYPKGRFNPRDAYLLTGSPLGPGAGR